MLLQATNESAFTVQRERVYDGSEEYVYLCAHQSVVVIVGCQDDRRKHADKRELNYEEIQEDHDEKKKQVFGHFGSIDLFSGM